MTYRMPVYKDYALVYEGSVLSDDDDINMMVRFIAENRFPSAEVYVETEVFGQYGGGGYTEHGEGSGGFSGSGDFRVRHDAPWPTYEDRTATGPLVEHDGQEWPVWSEEWDYIRAPRQSPRQASTPASGKFL
ncbi:unnamed protein product [Linum trigynum]|uniref:Uncharacterized protein n=1 Tax=Linum trigynum TaxID=586398 RepID=A0AAV2GJN0_9ROSI